MAYLDVNGPLGLQGRHHWSGGFMLNDMESMPRVDLDRITGLFSLPDVDDLRDPRIGANGEVLYPSFTRGKTVTYEGRLITPTGDRLYSYRWEMLGAFAEQSDEGTMTMTPHPDWGGGGWAFQARVLGLDIDDEIITDKMTKLPSPYQLHFVLSLRMRNNDITML